MGERPRQTRDCYTPDMDMPVMRIGAAAALLGVSVKMVRIYEERGLVTPARRKGQRLYSFSDVCWLGRVRQLVNEQGYHLEEVGRLISLPACWQLKNCAESVREKCPVATSPGKRCWEMAAREKRSSECRSCQIHRLAGVKAA